MRGSAALAAAKRRRSGTESSVNTIINNTGHRQGTNSPEVQQINTSNLQLSPTAALN